MSPENIFRKTLKGRDEIEKRTLRIDARRRTLLILVDGQASAAQLAGKLAHIPNSPELLQSLWSEGFVEPIGEIAAQAAPQDAAALAQLKRDAVRQVERLMGPAGEGIALRLERAATRAEFMAAAAKTRDAIAASLGPRQAEEFWKALG